MYKLLLIIFIALLINGCATTPSNNLFQLQINSAKNANQGDNILVVYEQPSSIQKMTQTNYDKLSTEVLNANHQTQLIHPQDKTTNIIFKSKNEPASLYILLNTEPQNTNWKYYITNPQKNWSCNIDKNNNIACNPKTNAGWL